MDIMYAAVDSRLVSPPLVFIMMTRLTLIHFNFNCLQLTFEQPFYFVYL